MILTSCHRPRAILLDQQVNLFEEQKDAMMEFSSINNLEKRSSICGRVVPMLKEYSAQARKWYQDLGFPWAKQWKYTWRHWLTTSVCPSDLGWYKVAIRRRVRLSWNSSCQNWPKKTTSRSYRMERGKPCNLMISLQNKAATVLAVKGCDRARKWLYLLKLSATTRMVSNPLEEGKPTMKSREISSQIRLGIGRGCNRQAGAKVSYLCCWQTKQFWKNSLTSCFKLGQKKFAVIRFRVFKYPPCP